MYLRSSAPFTDGFWRRGEKTGKRNDGCNRYTYSHNNQPKRYIPVWVFVIQLSFLILSVSILLGILPLTLLSRIVKSEGFIPFGRGLIDVDACQESWRPPS